MHDPDAFVTRQPDPDERDEDEQPDRVEEADRLTDLYEDVQLDQRDHDEGDREEREHRDMLFARVRQSDRRPQACVVPVTEKRYAVVVPSAT